MNHHASDPTNSAFNATIEPAGAEEPGDAGASVSTDLTAIRDLVLRAHPDVVPELIGGETVDELLGSIATAQESYQRLAESFRPATNTPPTVPAGGERPMPADPDRLPTSEKIRRGLSQSGR